MWAASWREAGKGLAEIKRAELRALDTRVALQQLADAFEAALLIGPARATSGLVEQQRIFEKLRP